MAQSKALDRQTLEQALDELGRRTHAEDKTIEIAIYGDSALMLTYNWRVATRDVDAVFENGQTDDQTSGARHRRRERLGSQLAERWRQGVSQRGRLEPGVEAAVSNLPL
jgi:hypothetical protein